MIEIFANDAESVTVADSCVGVLTHELDFDVISGL
jgi:hypothetical protein